MIRSAVANALSPSKAAFSFQKILRYFRDFHKSYFNPLMYVAVLLFIAGLIVFNYTFDFEDSYIDSYRGSVWRIPLFLAYHGLAYYGVLLIILAFNREKIRPTWKFWLKSFVGLFIISIDRSVFPFISDPILEDVHVHTLIFYRRIINNAYGWITIVAVLVILKYVFDRKENFGIYGLRRKHVDFRAYVILFLIMIPIVFAASYIQEFVDYYPVYKRGRGSLFSNYYGIKEIYAIVVYEFFYVADFLSTELIFRGFLIIGLSRLMGKNVVLPMAAAYAVLHFGKPLGETISSVFGGYILGILALYSRNIWGGVFIHGGIALLMEVFAFAQQ